MAALIALVGFLVVMGSVLAMAEASLSRVDRVQALALREEGRRGAERLLKIEEQPARHLNSVYLAVMFAQNGSAILVAFLANKLWPGVWVTVASAVFTLLYFVLVEAMSKTFAILHSSSVALSLAPLVSVLARFLSLPTRMLIGLSNLLLPGKGIKSGPFVSEEYIRSVADVGHEEGTIEEEQKEFIHSIFEVGDTLAREVMVPRPDMIVVAAQRPIGKAMDLTIKHGVSRIPVYDKEPDNITGIVYAKDLFKALRRNGDSDKEKTVKDVMREAFFVPETKPVLELLREMQKSRTHMAIVADEYGDVAGLVTLEDLIEEIVGEISDEYDVAEPDLVPMEDGKWRVKAGLPIGDLNELLDVELPEDEDWTTVGGLVVSKLGKMPQEGDEVSFEGLGFRAEGVNGRRIGTVVVTKSVVSDDGAA
ncbi:MAG TPA: hemolysin family protein [Actinomycetota bacterium]|nr:hemolysin family protein [Actinomycetota bacterium]